MIINTNSIDTLIATSHNPQLLSQIYYFMNEVIGDEGKLFTSDSSPMSMIGYCFVPYKTAVNTAPYPLISIAPQKNNISIYIMGVVDGQFIVPNYAPIFGKSNIGKSCIRIKTMNEDKYEALAEILKRTIATITD